MSVFRIVAFLACVAGVFKKARDGNETASECKKPSPFSLTPSLLSPILCSQQARSFARPPSFHGKGKETSAMQDTLQCIYYLLICLSQVQELGGVPLMTKASDMSCTIPDEKVSKSIVSFFSRLLTFVRSCFCMPLQLKARFVHFRLLSLTWRICARVYQIYARKRRPRAAFRWPGDDIDLKSNWSGKRFGLK